MWPTYKPISWDKYYAHNFSDKHASITSGLAAGITIGVFFTVFLLTFGCRIYSRRTAADATATRQNAEVARLRRRPSVSQLFRASPPPPYELAIQMPKPADLPPCGHFAFEPPPSFSELPPVIIATGDNLVASAPRDRRLQTTESLPSVITPSNGVVALTGIDSSKSLETSPKVRKNSPTPAENASEQIPTDTEISSIQSQMKNSPEIRSLSQRRTTPGGDSTRSQTEFTIESTSSSSSQISNCESEKPATNNSASISPSPSTSSATLASVSASMSTSSLPPSKHAFPKSSSLPI